GQRTAERGDVQLGGDDLRRRVPAEHQYSPPRDRLRVPDDRLSALRELHRRAERALVPVRREHAGAAVHADPGAGNGARDRLRGPRTCGVAPPQVSPREALAACRVAITPPSPAVPVGPPPSTGTRFPHLAHRPELAIRPPSPRRAPGLPPGSRQL